MLENIVNSDQARSWDGDDGDHWTEHEETYNRAVARHHVHLMRVAAIQSRDRVLDVGCGTGWSTCDAARAARIRSGAHGRGRDAAHVVACEPPARMVRPAGERGPPCAIDGRLHAWEWRRGADGRPIKLDGLDHCEAHDLIGAQDLAWDVAAAGVELGMDTERLRRIAAAQAQQALDPGRVAFQSLAYLAFQIGWWTFAAQGCEGERDAARINPPAQPPAA